MLFSKYSNERDPRLSIRTDIVREGGETFVRKSAADGRARKHIAHMAEAEKRLREAFRGTRFLPNRVLLAEPVSAAGSAADMEEADGPSALVFEYLKGTVLEEAADQALLKGGDRLEDFLGQYLAEVSLLAGEAYRPSRETEAIFGSTGYFTGRPAVGTADIDLVLGNIIASGGTYHVIDYEWTFFDPVPLDYIRWRILHYYLEGNTKRLFLDSARYMERFGIGAEMAAACASMEAHFQKYVSGERVPRRDIYDDVSPGFITLGGAAGAGRASSGRVLEFSLYPDSGTGFSEGTRKLLRTDRQGIAEIECSVAGLSSVRLDPTEEPCILELLYLETDRGALSAEAMPSNGFVVDSGHFLFSWSDPWVVFCGWSAEAEMLYAGIRITPLSAEGDAAVLSALFEKALDGEREKGRDLRRLLAARTELSDAIRNGKGGRLLRASGRLLKKPDPFGGFHPALENDPAGICSHLDQCVLREGEWFLRGWCFDRTLGIDSIRAEDPAGEVIAETRPCGYRQDVAELFGLDPLIPYEYTLLIPEGRAPESIILRFENMRGVLKDTIPLASKPREGESSASAESAGAAKAMSGPDPAAFRRMYGEISFTRRFPGGSGAGFGAASFKAFYAGEGIKPGEIRADYYIVTSFPFFGEDGSGEEGAAVPQEDGGFLQAEGAFSESLLRLLGDAIAKDQAADLLYGDFLLADKEDPSVWIPVLSPSFSPALLASWNYFGPVFAVRADVLGRAAAGICGTGKLRIPSGMKYYELLLCLSAEAGHVVHIPGILSRADRSFCEADEDSARILTGFYSRQGIPASAWYDRKSGLMQTEFEYKDDPIISIIIPNRDHQADLEKCIRSIEENSDYRNLEYVIVENNSTEPQTFAFYETLKKDPERYQVITWDGPFNYSAINNFGAQKARGRYLLFLNNDTELLYKGSLRRMAGWCRMPGTAGCGARLLYGDGTIQHAGVVIGYGGLAGHAFAGMPGDDPGYMKLIRSARDVSAVTAACLMVRREAFVRAGGFTEDLAVAFNDIDLCLKCKELGLRVIYDGGAVFSHYESKSRGYENSLRKRWRYEKEKAYFRERWAGILEEGDPFYHPMLSLLRADYSLKDPEERGKDEQ